MLPLEKLFPSLDILPTTCFSYCKSKFPVIMSSDATVMSSVSVFQTDDVTYQLVQLQDGIYEIAESNTSPEADKQEMSDLSTAISPTSSESSFQESLDALFNSILPDDESESTDAPEMITEDQLGDPLFDLADAPEMITEDRLGDPLHSLIVTLEEQQSTPTLQSSLMDIPANSPLVKHPFFNDLRGILMMDCQQTDLPSHLFETLGADESHVTLRRQQLEVQLQQLGARFPEKVGELSTLYEYYSAAVESERMSCLQNQTSDVYKTWLNSNFNAQLIQVIDRVQTSLNLLEDSNKPTKTSSWMSEVRHRPTLSKKAIQLMEYWYESNLHHPYPSATVTEAMAHAGSISVEQVKKWFGNKRNRGGNTRTLTEIAKRKHRLRHMSSQQHTHNKMIGSLALYI